MKHFEDVRHQEANYLMPTYSRFSAALVSGKGAVAEDTEGKKYIDFGSGIGVNSLGFCDDGWVAAVSHQAAALQHISNLYYSPVQTQLAETLCRLTGFDRVFFCNSGAEANECAIKLARKYSVEKYGKGRTNIITLKNSFHGRTVTTLAATGQEAFHDYFFPFTEGFSYAEANNLDDLKEKADENTCAVFIELIQGEGGVMPLDGAYVKALAAYCKERDILLLCDEVQTGVGRCGALYCYERYGIRPDVVTSAKGLGGGVPIGACLCRRGLGKVLSAGQHGTTFGGNPIACAAAEYVLSRVGNKAFLQDVEEKGDYIREKLARIPGVHSIRGLGLMIGVVLEEGYTARAVAAKCVENGLLLLTAKELVRLLPPLTITYDEIDKGIAVFEKTMKGE